MAVQWRGRWRLIRLVTNGRAAFVRPFNLIAMLVCGPATVVRSRAGNGARRRVWGMSPGSPMATRRIPARLSVPCLVDGRTHPLSRHPAITQAMTAVSNKGARIDALKIEFAARARAARVSGAVQAHLRAAVGVARTGLRLAAPLIDLFVRLSLTGAFFTSGMLKLGNWPLALRLAQQEYPVSWLDPDIAAVLPWRRHRGRRIDPAGSGSVHAAGGPGDAVVVAGDPVQLPASGRDPVLGGLVRLVC